jgi:hypothetical protein
MTRACIFRSEWSSRLLVISLAIGVGLGHACAVAQETTSEGHPAAKLSDSERVQRLQQIDRHKTEAVRLANSGQLDDAVREAEAALAVERQVLGKPSEGVAELLDFLAQVHEGRGDWAAARKAGQDVLALREHQPGERLARERRP